MADLFYVIGASGAGKDSLLDYARHHVPDEAGIVFTHRYITRPADAGGENHVALSVEEFQRREQLDCFAMSWFSHETHYGIGIEIHQWLAKGLDVVINGSRAYLPVAARKYPELVPVLIRVAPDVLASRLLARGRENPDQIQQRLRVARELESSVQHPRLVKIDNNHLLEEAGEPFVRVISRRWQNQCA